MNQQQTKHARERIQQISETKMSEVKRKFAYIPSNKDMTVKQKTDQIKSGKAKFNCKYDADSYVRISQAFIFEGEEKEKQMREKASQKIAEELKKIEVKRNELIDELILGDASEVLSKIREFEKM